MYETCNEDEKKKEKKRHEMKQATQHTEIYDSNSAILCKCTRSV